MTSIVVWTSAWSCFPTAWIVDSSTTHEGLLILILLALGYRAWQKESPRSDWRIFAELAALLVMLSVLTMIRGQP